MISLYFHIFLYCMLIYPFLLYNDLHNQQFVYNDLLASIIHPYYYKGSSINSIFTLSKPYSSKINVDFV